MQVEDIGNTDGAVSSYKPSSCAFPTEENIVW